MFRFEIARAVAVVVSLGCAGLIGWTLWELIAPSQTAPEIVSDGTHHP